MEFDFVAREKVRFRDVDMMGHVNNATYLSFLEVARMEFWEKFFGTDYYSNHPYLVGEITIRYVSPALIREQLDFGIRITGIGRSTFDLEYLIREASTARTVVTAHSRQVMIDLKTRKSAMISDDFRSRIKAMYPECPERT